MFKAIALTAQHFIFKNVSGKSVNHHLITTTVPVTIQSTRNPGEPVCRPAVQKAVVKKNMKH